jgi:aminoglycoside 6'-N-acetyltransferase I
MDFTVRQMGVADRAAWVAMRAALWPGDSADAHAAWIDGMMAGTTAWGFVAETPAREAIGFAEVAIRPYANGCDSAPVPFLEGIWIAPALRRRGAGSALMAHAAAFVRTRGFHEMGSDAYVDDHVSHASHRRWGFKETERVVYFRKDL